MIQTTIQRRAAMLLATAALFLTFQLSPFSAKAQRFDATVMAGLNMCQIDGDGAGRYNHPGLRAGIGTSFALGSDEQSPWRMVVELAFAQKGSVAGDEYFHRDISLNYVELPLMLSYNCFDNRLRLAAGVAPAVLVGARVTDDGSDNQPLADTYKPVDLLPLAASVRYRITSHLGIEGRYENSMLSISNNQGSGTYRISRDNKGTFSRLVSIGLTYTF